MRERIMATIAQLRAALCAKANQEKAKVLQRFFKTGKGEYGQGDVFLGLTVPQCRMLTKEYRELSLVDIEKLLRSKIHEERLVALLILVQRYHDSSKTPKRDSFARPSSFVPQPIVQCYLANTRYVNNWDLVDLSAPKILGAAIFGDRIAKSTRAEDRGYRTLTRLARSKNLWERRIAMVATLYLIQHNQFTETLRIARILLQDRHDLIHKAVGWMLREVGKRNFNLEEKFVRKHAAVMPRTMLRYAIERWPDKLRKEVMR